MYNSGAVTIQDSTLSGNRVFSSDRGSYGGGLYSYTGALTIRNSSIYDNSADDEGGGLYVYEATLTILSSRISGNASGEAGGGLFSDESTLTVVDSTISGNIAGTEGGGFYNRFYVAATFTNSTISGNSAGLAGGGLFSAHGLGAPPLVLTNVTLTLNSAGGSGGGIAAVTMPDFLLANTVLAGNTAATGPDCSTRLFSQGYNLLGDSTGCNFTAGEGDQVGTGGDPIDPLLDPLQDNGGPTFTHALLDGSPAIDAGNPTGCTDDQGNLLTSDQRGFGRPVDGNGDGLAICDIGAYEYGSRPVIDANRLDTRFRW